MKETSWDIKEIESFFGNYASRYDQEIEADRQGYPAPFVIGSWILDFLLSIKKLSSTTDKVTMSNKQNLYTSELPNYIKILDLGCGTGQSSSVFFSHPNHDKFSIIGVDATPQMLEKANNFPFTELICKDIEKTLDFPQSPFDAIGEFGQ